MTVLIIVLVSLLVVLLALKFAEALAGLSLIFIGGILLGIVVVAFNPKLGVTIITWSFCLFVIKWVLLGIAGLVSGVVMAPVALIWGGIKLFFGRLFK